MDALDAVDDVDAVRKLEELRLDTVRLGGSGVEDADRVAADGAVAAAGGDVGREGGVAGGRDGSVADAADVGLPSVAAVVVAADEVAVGLPGGAAAVGVPLETGSDVGREAGVAGEQDELTVDAADVDLPWVAVVVAATGEDVVGLLGGGVAVEAGEEDGDGFEDGLEADEEVAEEIESRLEADEDDDDDVSVDEIEDGLVGGDATEEEEVLVVVEEDEDCMGGK